jgi:hypothetical protein
VVSTNPNPKNHQEKYGKMRFNHGLMGYNGILLWVVGIYQPQAEKSWDHIYIYNGILLWDNQKNNGIIWDYIMVCLKIWYIPKQIAI